MSKITSVAVIAAAVLAGVGAGWWFAQYKPTAFSESNPSEVAIKKRQVLYWYDPMKPDAHFDQPGRSPFMDMDLVPRYADEEGTSQAGIAIDPSLLQNTGIRYAEVTKGQLVQAVEVSASVVFNAREFAVIQARTSGIIERAYPLADGDVVQQGDPLVDVRVPQWLAAQNEFLVLRNDPSLAQAARSKLLQLGMSKEQIQQLIKHGKALEVITITSPRAGMISDLNVREGAMLAENQTIAQVNGLASVWVEALVPETQSAQVYLGSPVQVLLAAFPNEPLEAQVSSIVPQLDAATRTLRVRIEIPNSLGRLRPGMYARLLFKHIPSVSEQLLVPSDAVIATGKNTIVIVADENNRFIPAEVRIGREAGNYTEILSGLKEGERVVVSGQFMIDSEASLRSAITRMNVSSQSASLDHIGQHEQIYVGVGVVKEIFEDEVTLDHEPVPALKWPSMVMSFELAKPGLAYGFQVGDVVEFDFIQRGNGPVIQSIQQSTRGIP